MNKHKSNKKKQTHIQSGTDHHISGFCCNLISPARRTITLALYPLSRAAYAVGISSSCDLWALNLTHCGLVTHYGDIILGQHWLRFHYSDAIMGAMASQITGDSIVYSTICPGANQRNHESPASLASVRGIHRWPVNSPHKITVTRKMFPFDDVIMQDVTKSLPEPMFIYHK